MLSMVPWGFLLRLAAPFAIAGAVFLFGYSSGKAGVQREWDKAVAAQAEVNLEAERMVRQAEQRKFTAAKESQDALTTRLTKARSDAAGAKSALDGLLNAAQAASNAARDPSAAVRAAGAAVPWDVFAGCARALQAVAESADTLEARLIGWQQWWGAVKP